MRGIVKIAAWASVLIAMPAQAETLTNDTVVQLVKIGLGEDAIIAKIDSSDSAFDVSTDGMIGLSQAGVSSAIIAKMISAGSEPEAKAPVALSIDSPDPAVPHPSGVYLLADWQADPKMVVIDPTTSNQTKTGGFFGYLMTGGIASMSFQTVIPNAKARAEAPLARPVFYFYFGQPGADGEVGSFWTAGTAATPAEFSLVKFKVKKNTREARVGSFNIGGAKSGVMDKDRIPFTYSLISPGVYKAQPDVDLATGEYGFLYSTSTSGGAGLSGGGATTARIFDFSIDNPVSEPTDKKSKSKSRS